MTAPAQAEVGVWLNGRDVSACVQPNEKEALRRKAAVLEGFVDPALLHPTDNVLAVAASDRAARVVREARGGISRLVSDQVRISQRG